MTHRAEDRTTATAGEPQESGRLVEVDGTPLWVSVRGHGRGHPLLMINGLGAHVDMWEPLRRQLDRETIAFDAPGAGHSPTPRTPRTMGGLGRMTARLVEQLGYDRVDVLGVSFGGGVAQYLAITSPERVRKLVLASTVFGVGSIPGRPAALLHMLTPMRYMSRRYLEVVRRSLYGGPAGPGRAVEPLPAAWFSRPPSMSGYAGQLFATSTWWALPHLGRIPHETLVLAGGDDPLVRDLNTRILGSLIPRAQVRIVRDGGHLYLFEQPHDAARIISGFLG